jgi:BolA family transcriptional regulator, general stress-responsive regulator
MELEESIKRKLKSRFNPAELEIVNESGNHAVPANSETHFKIIIVSDAFQEKTLVQRHREIYTLLAAELRSGVHALAIHALTPQEWQKTKGRDFSSPPCSKS